MQLDLVFAIAILVFSVVAHEVSHGYVAEMLGDPTARLAGRLTLNPLKHVDPIGSVILPLLLVLSHSPFLIGWAKPVPYNPYQLKNKRWGEALVAGAGPVTNLVIALLFGLVIRFSEALSLSQAFVELSGVVVYINILLALFNLIPIPPLDGSKVLASVLPFHASRYLEQLSLGGMGLLVSFGFLILFVYLLWPFFRSIVSLLFSIFTGLPL